MLQTQRNYVYKNKQLFKSAKASKEDTSLPCFVVDFDKTYDWNKRQLEKTFNSRTPGIWVIEDSKEDIKSGVTALTYEVAQTTDILRESIKGLQWLFLGKRDARKNVYANYSRKVYTRYKYQQIYLLASRKTKAHHPTKLVFRQVIVEPDKETRLRKEIYIAIKREAYYWSPDPNQTKVIFAVLKGNDLDEEFNKLELNRKYIPKKKQRRRKCKTKNKSKPKGS